jgi:hypothetical protein
MLFLGEALKVCQGGEDGSQVRSFLFISFVTFKNMILCRIRIYITLPLTILLIILSILFLQDRALPFQRYQDIPGKGYQIHPFRLSSNLFGSPVIIVHCIEMS